MRFGFLANAAEIPFHSCSFHSIPFHSIRSIHSTIPFHSIPIHSIPFKNPVILHQSLLWRDHRTLYHLRRARIVRPVCEDRGRISPEGVSGDMVNRVAALAAGARTCGG